jgi:hypothetical protein
MIIPNDEQLLFKTLASSQHVLQLVEYLFSEIPLGFQAGSNIKSRRYHVVELPSLMMKLTQAFNRTCQTSYMISL